MFLKHIDLTTALRPLYLPDEVLLFVQDNVGLYEGKYKLPQQQNGQVYLTSHRICYVDRDQPRKHSVALDLKEVEGYEFYSGFLKSSPKITLIPKPKRVHAQSRTSAASPVSSLGRPPPSTASSSSRLSQPDLQSVATATWVCTICGLPNPVPSNFDPTTASENTPLPPCLACGIKPTLAHVLKASISNASQRLPGGTGMGSPIPVRPYPSSSTLGEGGNSNGPPSTAPTSPLPSQSDVEATFRCPRCTFDNHPSLLSCEVCGAPLISQDLPSPSPSQPRIDSPGPVSNGPSGFDTSDVIKISFRAGGGGEKIFYERLKGSMTQRKWLSQGAPQLPKNNRTGDETGNSRAASGSGTRSSKAAGIAALEQRGLDMRRNNEVMIGDAFEDLESLMAYAKEIVALAEQFTRQVNGSNGVASLEASALVNQLGLVTTKDIVGGGSSGSESLYLSELSRNLAEFLTDDARGVLKKAGGIISLVDLWAMFNRARGGVELVSPMDFEKAARLWETLRLPVRLRQFKSGVLVVQSRDRTDETTIRSLLSWLQDLHEFPPDREVSWDWHQFGIGVTAQDVAERFGWSIGVAEEELEMAEERGVVCREKEGIEGLKFWKNYIDTGDVKLPLTVAEEETKKIERSLKAAGFL